MLFISTHENNYLCGGVNYDQDAAKEKQRRRKRKYSVLIVIYAPAEVIICLSANIPRNRLGASIDDAQYELANVSNMCSNEACNITPASA